jgi:hypothetical protein
MSELKKFAVITHDDLRVRRFQTKDELQDAIIAILKNGCEFTPFKFYFDLGKWVAFDLIGCSREI